MLRKVLYVDDDQIFQVVIEQLLSAYRDKFTLVLADDGFDAVKKLEKQAFSLICLDLIMPRMDGASLLAHVHEKYPDIPVIIVSSMGREKVGRLAEAEGVVGLFTKPIDSDDLGRRIVEVLREEAQGGTMNHVSPVTFMQLMEMEGKTCTIRMLDNSSGQGGILYLRDGELLDVRVGDRTGIEAAYQVFSWEDVSVFFHNGCIRGEKRIHCELQSVIMGALAAKDERDESPAGNAEGGPAGTIAGIDGLEDTDEEPSSPAARNLSGSLEELLQREFGGEQVVETVTDAHGMVSVVAKLDSLGVITESGKFQLARVEGTGGRNRIVVAGGPPVVLGVRPGADAGKIMQVLLARG